MRLKPEQITAIKAAAVAAFGSSAVVRLFGSRVDDLLRGGDIDLHVESDAMIDERSARAIFERRLFEAVEPRKVDLVISQRGGTPHGFERIAYRDGIIL